MKRRMVLLPVAVYMLVTVLFCNDVAAIKVVANWQFMADQMHALLKQRRYQAVIDNFEILALPNNDNAEFFLWLAVAHFKLERNKKLAKEKLDFSTAIKYLERAHELDPQNSLVIVNLMQLHTWTKRYGLAHEYANKYLETGEAEHREAAEYILKKFEVVHIDANKAQSGGTIKLNLAPDAGTGKSGVSVEADGQGAASDEAGSQAQGSSETGDPVKTDEAASQ